MDLSRFFPWMGQAEQRSTFTLNDPRAIEMLGLGMRTASGETVSEATSLGVSAVYAAVRLTAGTVASLPLKSYRKLESGDRERVPSFLDQPGGPNGPTPYEWKQTLVAHRLLHGNAYGLHIYNGAGALVGLQLMHPGAVTIEVLDNGRKLFTVQTTEGQKKFTEDQMTHFPGLSLDGVKGVSVIGALRNSIGIALASDKAAGKIFANSLMAGGLVTVPNDFDEEEAKTFQTKIRQRMGGADNAGEIQLINADVKFHPWTMNPQDAQFIESRAFQVEDIARIFGIPKVLLAQDGASTWGSGIAELNRLWRITSLGPLTSSIEDRLSRLLNRTQADYCEFDYAGLLAPSTAEETKNLVAEVDAGLLTLDEARKLKNRPPLTPAQKQEVKDRIKPAPQPHPSDPTPVMEGQ